MRHTIISQSKKLKEGNFHLVREVSFNSHYVPLQSHTKAKPEYKAKASISSFLSSKIKKNEIKWAKLATMLRQ